MVVGEPIPMDPWVRRWPVVVAAVLSFAVHALFVAPSIREVHRADSALVLNPRIPSPAASERALDRARLALLNHAREQRDAGRLQLGHLLIRAAAIDALGRCDSRVRLDGHRAPRR